MCKEPKRFWITKTVNLEGIDFVKHPKIVEELLSIDSNVKGFFNFKELLVLMQLTIKANVWIEKLMRFEKF